ncbi:phage holin family protein [Microcella alkalica]|uniref:Holin-X, holin superfamily III n=1 Tax=Microcella alkalica TaxID=355930 RepID=A0A839E7I3_9MICO|nr:phage holin family protein [Microcella alkalica]MBA8848609.1 hypothetical protein [Microcella alkalica]
MTTPRTTPSPAAERRGLFALIADVPRLIGDLVRAEIASLKAEIAGKLKAAGIGAGLLVGAGVVAFFAALVLIAAGVLALSLVLPPWAASLIIGVVLLIIAGIIAAAGIRSLKRGMPPTPTDTIESVKDDVRAVRGQRK